VRERSQPQVYAPTLRARLFWLAARGTGLATLKAMDKEKRPRVG